ncbi:TetR/AcrR family transcriptional regulator [Rhodococcus sp. TAF43]|uniref:TetR/AcrR family transcriptional regulator n=1 Tax=unclassified Rhodococcus (in: high G+C Gram-positive bacteria) TaxID=192944 RepID=UPI000E2D2D31|nr:MULTISPECIES: TetR/AcrR family transcriptional regulator [unclassified Rhodococcus (in: high G+C Gram-positive bacteria)]RDI13066.1 TetR family transcriptional regulator [Rhodococcus sp. AG1013]
MVDTVYMETVRSLRDELVSAGVELLEAAGASGVSLRAITRRAGVSHGAPRRYFPTHNALLAAIAVEGFSDLAVRLRPSLDGSSAPARDRLVALGIAYVEFARDRPAMFELMFRHDLLEGAGENLRATTLPLFAALHGLVEDASNDTDAGDRALAIWVSLHGTAVLVANRSLQLVAGDAVLEGLVGRVIGAHLVPPT